MKKTFLNCLGVGLFSMLQAQTPEIVQIQVNTSKPVATTGLKYLREMSLASLN